MKVFEKKSDVVVIVLVTVFVIFGLFAHLNNKKLVKKSIQKTVNSSSKYTSISKEITDRERLNYYCNLINNYGYVCPRVALAYNKGYVPEGILLKVFCGPKTGGVYSKLVYRLIVGTNTGQLKSLTKW